MRNSDVVMLWHVDVYPDSGNPRRRFDEDELQALARSIQEHGLLQPIIVRPRRDFGVDKSAYLIVAGERRWRACAIAGLKEIPCIIRRDLDDAAAMKVQLVENLQRKDLDAIEEADGYRQLHEVLGLKQRQIAEAVHRSQPAVANRMRLLELPEDVQERIRQGELTPAHGVALAAWRDFPAVCSKLGELASAGEWTTRKLEDKGAGLFDLQREGLVCYLQDIDMAVECRQKCPRGAYRHGIYSSVGVCYRPECYAERHAEQDRLRADKGRALLDEKKAQGEAVLEPDQAETMAHRELWHEPAGCRKDCDKRATTVNWQGTARLVCLDPKCFARLERAATRAGKRGVVAEADQMLAQLVERLDAVPEEEIGMRDLLFFVAMALEHQSGAYLQMDEVGNRLRLPRLPSQYWEVEKADLAGFDGVPPVRLMKAILEMVMRAELAHVRAEKAGVATWTRAYLAPPREPEAPVSLEGQL